MENFDNVMAVLNANAEESQKDMIKGFLDYFERLEVKVKRQYILNGCTKPVTFREEYILTEFIQYCDFIQKGNTRFRVVLNDFIELATNCNQTAMDTYLEYCDCLEDNETLEVLEWDELHKRYEVFAEVHTHKGNKAFRL